MWITIIEVTGTILVAIIGLIGILFQTKHSNKLDEQKIATDAIRKEISDLRKESKQDDETIIKKIVSHDLLSLKRFLVSELTKIKEGFYIPTEEQKRILKEAKDEYNGLGGDSYVDDMYEDLRNKGLI